jgi:hypothetical protein
MTQETIAGILGFRREGVAEAMGQLQKAGTIQVHHGRSVVVDKRALEAQVCECYAVVKREYERLCHPESSMDIDKVLGSILRPRHGL